MRQVGLLLTALLSGGRARTGAGDRRSAGARQVCLAPAFGQASGHQKPKPRPTTKGVGGCQAAKAPSQQAAEKPAAAPQWPPHRRRPRLRRRRRHRPRCRPHRRTPSPWCRCRHRRQPRNRRTATTAADLGQRRQRGNPTGAGLRVTFGAGQSDLSPASAAAIKSIVQSAPAGDSTSLAIRNCRRQGTCNVTYCSSRRSSTSASTSR